MASASKILIVEDDEDTRLNLRDILELDGFEIGLAATGREACSKLASREFVIAVLDRSLPDTTADQILPALRAASPDTEFVVVTGFVDLDSTLVALRHGAADYILKPINPDALRSSIHRIIERREIARQLQREYAFSDRILKTAEAMVVVLDLDGSVVRFNPYFEKISGWTMEEAVGKDWFQLVVPIENRQRLRDRFLLIDHRDETRADTHHILTKQGPTRNVRWSISTLLDEYGRMDAVLAIGLDITDFVEAQTRALQAERLATIGQTMTALAHESRNALQRIQASTEILELELGQNSAVSSDIRSISKAVKDLHGILEEVRSFAAPVHLTLTPCCLAGIWRRAWHNLLSTRRVPDNMTAPVLREHGLEHDTFMRIDELRMEQVFRNLFENALAACDGQAKVEVELAPLLTPAGVLSGVAVTIADNGCGMNREQAERIFEPFYTTKQTGTGLGMAIVRRIVEAHHGQIRVVMDAAPGAKLLLHLPLDPFRGLEIGEGIQ